MRPTWMMLGLLTTLATTPPPAGAQVVTEPTFEIPGATIRLDVAAAYSGLYFLRESTDVGALILERRVDGVWQPGVIVNESGPAGAPVIAATAAGGFAAAWYHIRDVFARFLDAIGTPAGSQLQVSSDGGFLSGTPRVAGLANGVAIVWDKSAPEGGYSLHAQIGSVRHELPAAHDWEIASTPAGGCIVAWRSYLGQVLTLQAQIFDGAGATVTPELPLAPSEMKLGGVAMDPSGATFAITALAETATPPAFEVWLHRFTADGMPLGPPILVDTTVGIAFQSSSPVLPKIDFDLAGDALVVWGTHAAVDPGVRARAYAPDGTPFGPTVAIGTGAPRTGVQLTRTPDGQFVTTWVTGTQAFANVVSLCASGSAVCGDGVLAPACERCDDGPGNSDAAPDACRTSCLPAHCGDGVVDAGEQCDDGNFDPCDGCSPTCVVETGVVCGDGVTSTQCGEQCDDGNATVLDGCTPACRLERIPGGGSPKTDCLTEWTIADPTTVPAHDKAGALNWKQSCVDNDPRCDFDGGTPGSCTFHVRVCGNNSDLPTCYAPSRLSSWLLYRPSEKQAVKLPWLAAVRASFLGAVPAAIVGPTTPDVCSDELALTVPLRMTSSGSKPSRLKLDTRATSYEGVLDKDKLLLECRPAS